MESTLVIKAKCGDTLRRFNAPINENGLLDLDLSGLRAKILGLFNFPSDADFILTYVDEDGDVVTLVDDDDLVDVMNQSLKFLRVDVQLKNDKFATSNAKSSCGTSTHMRSPRGQSPLPNLNGGVADILKSVPEPLREALSKLSLDLASKAACSNSVVADLVDCVSKMGQSFLNTAQQPQTGASASTYFGTVENPVSSAGPTMPNATNSGTSRELRAENVTRDVGMPITPVPAPVDLNLDPPCDSFLSGCATNNFKQTVDGDNRKKNKKQNFGRPSMPVKIGALLDTSASVRPFGNECPFSGMPVANDLSAPPSVLPRVTPFKKSSGRNDGVVGMFHRGVQCDGCGVHPITGLRYKSKVREDYDLCSICFSEMGNEADYIMIARPVSYRRPHSFKGLQDPKYWVSSLPTDIMKPFGPKPLWGKLLDSHFVMDVNVLDGTVMAPSTPFTKIWRLRNSGTVAWPQGSRLVWTEGNKFSCAYSAELELPADGLPVDGEIDIAVDFISPDLPGRYLSCWKMASPSGTKFGQRVWVLINVDASTKYSVPDGVRGLNLNFPPDCSVSKCRDVIDVNVQPVTDSGIMEPSSSSSAVPVKPMVEVERPEKDQELNLPINNSLLVGNGVSNPASRQASPSVLYPIVDLSGAGPSKTVPAVDVPTSPEETDEKDVFEESLLKELEEMGFKQVDLNKEILRINAYNLEQSVDDLCGVSEWDPILEELQEMGFRNEEMNRKLLKKNNGSIKGVVMDLLTGEKA
ncbi:protein JOKA2 isoform X1 [Ricinus communis]|uniref:protein JOKA2 isoform X1 n=1 Tax=Ricinus communis TaxID=3988 RepID=UPI00077236DD|nr:protein JOKA2 isoform X1 [Ricinus communis]|eukprot:XP_015580599.1 protein NBR1 homolog isoform X1 [Ricinus communis]